jgi:transcriptional regulator with XRE-family HTH domain
MKSRKKEEINIRCLIGTKIRRRRMAVGIERKSLAASLNVSDGTVSNFEKGRHSISAERLWLVAAMLKCSPLDLLPPLPEDLSGFDKQVQAIEDEEAKKWLQTYI